MRKISLFFVLVFVCCLLILPVSAAELQGGYVFTCDCALGTGVTFYIPTNFASGSLTYDSSGNLFNLTSSTIYLYSPDYPNYTFTASRFSGFTYRSGNAGSTTTDLKIRNVRTENVEIFTEDPALSARLDVLEIFHTMVAIGEFTVAFLLLLKWRNVRV